MVKKIESTISKKTAELLDLLSLKGEISVEETEEVTRITIETDESSLLIGYHGENLESFQLMLSFLIKSELGEFKRILVDVGDYRQRREEKLKEMAIRAKEEVMQKSNEVTLPNLSSSDRRIIHLLLQEDEDVFSESIGEGRERQLIIKPKNRV